MKQIGPLFFPDSDTHFQVFEDEYGGVINYQKPQRDYTSQQVIPFFRVLYDRKLIEAYAAVAIQTLELEGGDQWRAANAASIEAYKQLMSTGR